MGAGSVAMLEYLDAYHQRVRPGGGQSAEIAADEVEAAAGPACRQLGEGRGGDIQTGQVPAAGHQRQVVAPVAAADVEAARQPGCPGGGQDVPGEGHRGLAAVAARPVPGPPNLSC